MESKINEFKAVESSWRSLDDSSIIRDVLYKGKYISQSIKFISERNEITIDSAKELFYDTCDNIIKILIQNRQLHRARHVLMNAQLNELYYFYNLYQEFSNSSDQNFILEHLKNNENFDETELKSYWNCYKLLQENVQKHAKYLESANRNHNTSAVNPSNIQKTSFMLFMKGSKPWKNVGQLIKIINDKKINHIIFSFIRKFQLMYFLKVSVIKEISSSYRY